MFIRPVILDDLDALYYLSEQVGTGMTSMKPNKELLSAKIERAVTSFAGACETPAHEGYLFVLEDPATQQVVGTSGIVCHIGLRQPFYSYKLSTITQVSQALDIYSKQDILSVVNDYTGASEIGSLYLLPEYRRDRLGRLLSRIRFLFMAQFRERFAEKVVAEIRGVYDRDGSSPFYNNLARHFFQMEFEQADYLCATQGNQFIADLMPKYPIYVSLLRKEARDVIGQPFASSEPAKAMLEKEGFFYNQYLDVFDGGPTLEAYIDELRTVKESALVTVKAIKDTVDAERQLVCTTGFNDFRGVI